MVFQVHVWMNCNSKHAVDLLDFGEFVNDLGMKMKLSRELFPILHEFNVTKCEIWPPHFEVQIYFGLQFLFLPWVWKRWQCGEFVGLGGEKTTRFTDCEVIRRSRMVKCLATAETRGWLSKSARVGSRNRMVTYRETLDKFTYFPCVPNLQAITPHSAALCHFKIAHCSGCKTTRLLYLPKKVSKNTLRH